MQLKPCQHSTYEGPDPAKLLVPADAGPWRNDGNIVMQGSKLKLNFTKLLLIQEAVLHLDAAPVSQLQRI